MAAKVSESHLKRSTSFFENPFSWDRVWFFGQRKSGHNMVVSTENYIGKIESLINTAHHQDPNSDQADWKKENKGKRYIHSQDFQIITPDAKEINNEIKTNYNKMVIERKKKVHIYDGSTWERYARIKVDGDPWPIRNTTGGFPYHPHYLLGEGTEREMKNLAKSGPPPDDIKEKMANGEKLIESLDERPSSSSSRHSSSSSHLDTLETLPEEYAYLIKPVDFLERSDIWTIVWYYAIKLLSQLKPPTQTTTHRDYIMDIKNLINSEVRQKGTYTFLDEYQIITPDRKVWHHKDIRAAASRHLSGRDDKFCTLEPCVGCPFKASAGPDETVKRHIIKMLGVLYHCVPCGQVYGSKTTITSHTEHCSYRCRVAMEHPDVGERTKPQKTEIETMRATIQPIQQQSSNTTEEFADKFEQWTKTILEDIKKDGFMEGKQIDELFNEMKKEMDYNFVHYFEQINKITSLTKQFKVTMESDQFYKIHYYSPTKTINEDVSKSAIFQILEVSTKKTVSVHRLNTIKTLIRNDNLCHYDFSFPSAVHKSMLPSMLYPTTIPSQLTLMINTKTGENWVNKR